MSYADQVFISMCEDILENGKTAVFAIKKKLEKDFPSEQFEENEDESGDFENLPF